jgi:hypothetical protein
MRSPYICLIALAVAVILVAQPVAALPVMQVPYVRAGPAWFLNPSAAADFVFIQANTSHLAAENSMALAISFVPTGTGAFPGLNLAPVIAQTSSQSLACDRSFFIQDFI